jgi:hypothetical protein
LSRITNTNPAQVTPEWLALQLDLPQGGVATVRLEPTFEPTAAFLTPLGVEYS